MERHGPFLSAELPEWDAAFFKLGFDDLLYYVNDVLTSVAAFAFSMGHLGGWVF